MFGQSRYSMGVRKMLPKQRLRNILPLVKAQFRRQQLPWTRNLTTDMLFDSAQGNLVAITIRRLAHVSETDLEQGHTTVSEAATVSITQANV